MNDYILIFFYKKILSEKDQPKQINYSKKKNEFPLNYYNFFNFLLNLKYATRVLIYQPLSITLIRLNFLLNSLWGERKKSKSSLNKIKKFKRNKKLKKMKKSNGRGFSLVFFPLLNFYFFILNFLKLSRQLYFQKFYGAEQTFDMLSIEVNEKNKRYWGD